MRNLAEIERDLQAMAPGAYESRRCELLKEARAQGVTYQRLADVLGVTKGAVWKMLEREKRMRTRER